MRKIYARLQLLEGERLPRGHGIAWYCFETADYVLYPIPLNVIARWARQFYHWCRKYEPGASENELQAIRRGAYQRGRKDGYIHAQEDQIAHEDRAWKRLYPDAKPLER